MLEKLYDFFGILVCLLVTSYGILLINLMLLKIKKIKNVKLLQNLTFLLMITTIIFIIVNFILELMLQKSKAYDIFFYIASCVGTIALYFIVKNAEKIVKKLF